MSIILKAEKREELNKKVKALREKGLIPAVLYGHKVRNKNLTLNSNEFVKVYQKAGTSTLVDLETRENKPVKVIITDIQRDPIKHNIIHVDLHQINMQEEITADVALNFIGEPPAVKTEGGVLLKNMESVEVKCLPSDLPHNLTVDLNKLDIIDSHFAIKDLEIPNKVKILNDPEDVIAVVKAMKIEEEPITSEEESEEKTEEESETEDEVKENESDDKKSDADK